jgi:predicted 2-oxoglutarate/Fe(II)-dependent dioxygenase YbiX
VNQDLATTLLPGDRAPPCYGISADHTFYSSEGQYGRPAVLILAGTDAVLNLRPAIDAFASRLESFADRNADVMLLLDDNPRGLWPDRPTPVRTIDCGQFLGRCGVGARDSLVLVLDRNLRLALRIHPADGRDVAAACLDCLDDLPNEAPRAVSQPAPAIVLPHLLPRDLCRTLIERFESSPTIDGEVARIDAAGNVRSVVDHDKKCRRDMPIPPDDTLHLLLRTTLLRRCAPEIAKAFQAKVSHIDRILVSRYNTNAGWFRRHRDNTADNVAFRQFALSVNLNTDEYEGGHLLFPEYNDHRYSPPAGGGVIFSTGVLHEAAPVTSGHRYVLLTFLHSDEAEIRRQTYLARAALDRPDSALART